MFESDLHDEIQNDQPAYTLHPVRGAVWAAFLGTPVAAGIVLAINFARVGDKAAARNAVVIGVLSTVALFAIIFALPDAILDKIPSVVFIVPQVVIVQMIAQNQQAEFIDAHEAAGGNVASAWPSVGIGFLCLPIVIGAGLGLVMMAEPSFGTLVTFGNDDIYYAGDATEADARKLAATLKEVEFFGSSGGTSVRIESASGQIAVSFVLIENAWADPETIIIFKSIGASVADSGFSTPLKIHLCDAYFVPKHTITIE